MEYANEPHSFQGSTQIPRLSVVLPRTQAVPIIENFIKSTFSVSNDAQIASIDNNTGVENARVQGPGQLTQLGYWASFEAAVQHRNNAVEKDSYSEFQSAIVRGIASIEGYLNYRAEKWNRKKGSEKLEDSVKYKVSIDEKITSWIPKMTGGKKLDKSQIFWERYKRLKKIRDDVTIHPKESSYGISLHRLAEMINWFRPGIAEFLIGVHKIFNDIIPRVIIRAAYSPDAIVIKE
jgi:hypothetical protein